MKLVLQELAETYYVSLLLETWRSCSRMCLCLGELVWLWQIRLGIISTHPKIFEVVATSLE